MVMKGGDEVKEKSDEWYAENFSSSMDPKRKARNENYIVHTMRLSRLPEIDLMDADKIRERTAEYMQMCSDDGIKPNMVGYSMALGTSRADLARIAGDLRMPREAAGEINRGIAMVENALVSMMLDGTISPVSGIFITKNHLGYQDQSDVVIRTQLEKNVDTKALENKYKSIAGLIED